ncbi:putative methanogenesis marker protein 8 [Methanosarcina siciliae T4/M]|uniref:Putative methanogenesis marker protein 8 n=1 Tax=Methanosarcina siciliae T4/M TaxID=1434120 RepID=A0A0E3P3Q1_9EURY|nr:putative methanogenesis marker protein 8 [Methanosarcina siciliae T4/M]
MVSYLCQVAWNSEDNFGRLQEEHGVQISDFGMFTEKRKLELEDFVSFDASEIMMTDLSMGLLDTTVTACEGSDIP